MFPTSNAQSSFTRRCSASPPAKQYDDYAKFELESPPMVLSLKPKRACVGGPLNHLGLRVTDPKKLEEAYKRLVAVNARIGRQDHVQCCYAEQTKLWITDPDGTLWEVYVFHDDVPNWGEIHNKPKLWKAPLQAFGITGVIKRWFNNAFRPTYSDDQSSITVEGIPTDTCKVSPDADSCKK